MAADPPTTLLALDQDSLIRVLTFCSVRDVLALGCACKQLSEALKVGGERSGRCSCYPLPACPLKWPRPATHLR